VWSRLSSDLSARCRTEEPSIVEKIISLDPAVSISAPILPSPFALSKKDLIICLSLLNFSVISGVRSGRSPFSPTEKVMKMQPPGNEFEFLSSRLVSSDAVG